MNGDGRQHVTLRTFLAFAVVVIAPLVWAADRPSARLSYAKKPNAAVCPDEEGFRARIAGRLGYDPFRDDADRTVVVTFSREGGTYRAKLELKEGGKVGTRVLTAADCNELASSTALAVAIAIDPLGGAPAAPSASSAPSASASVAPKASSSAAPTVIVKPTPLPPPSSPDTYPTVTLGAIGVYGGGPELAGGLTAGVGLHLPSFSLGIEGRVDAETSKPGPKGGRVSASILSGALVPCMHHEVLLGCLLLEYGSLRGNGSGVTDARSDRSPWGALGVRLGIEASLFGPIAFRVHADALAALTRTTLQVQGVDAWSSPPFQFLGGLAVVGRFR